jgi:hypothetical protein
MIVEDLVKHRDTGKRLALYIEQLHVQSPKT